MVFIVSNVTSEARRASGFFDRYYVVLAVAVLGLAAFNLAFRLGSEFVSEWDESLYAISAWEAVDKGSWIGTTFLGELDYYNTKPPLMVWLVALAFKAFGPSLASLRLVSALSAWLTVAALQYWTKRCFGSIVALLASLVLATTFGFVYVHSGRSAATDAPFTLVILLTVVTLWAEKERPALRTWLGPLLATAFLLRGMAVLMPLALVIVVLISRERGQNTAWRPTLSALALFLLPVAAWVVARYQVDGWSFFERLFMYDFVARSVGPLEEHPGGPLYYLNILQKHHYEWLVAGIVALLLFPVPWRRVRARLANWRDGDGLKLLLAAWAGVTLVIPTLMQTKVPWYLNPFYPVFAVGLALILARGFSAAASAPWPRWRLAAHSAVFVLMLGVAEGKLLWYSFHYRDVRLSEQSLMLAERRQLRGHPLYLERSSRAARFVADAVVGAQVHPTADRASFLSDSREGNYLLTAEPCQKPELDVVRSNGRHSLCRRRYGDRDPVR